jgi:hypothetical protein
MTRTPWTAWNSQSEVASSCRGSESAAEDSHCTDMWCTYGSKPVPTEATFESLTLGSFSVFVAAHEKLQQQKRFCVSRHMFRIDCNFLCQFSSARREILVSSPLEGFFSALENPSRTKINYFAACGRREPFQMFCRPARVSGKIDCEISLRDNRSQSESVSAALPLPEPFFSASPEVLVGEFIARNYRPTFASAGPLIMQ